MIMPPFRADVVGSYLRPDYLLIARAEYAQGKRDHASLTEIENRAITELVKQQQAAGLRAITDGEFRRSWWHLDFMWGLHGIERAELSAGYRFQGVESRPETARVCGLIRGENHPFVQHYRFLQQLARPGDMPRITVPAPAQFFKELYRPENRAETEKWYPEQSALIEAIINAYQTFISDIYAAGCRHLQLDDCTWGMMVDSRYHNAGVSHTSSGCTHCDANSPTVISQSLDELAEHFLHLNNGALANAPADFIVTTHVCRGNYRSTWAASGGYQPIAKALFGRENVVAYYLEFDTDRAGDFSPLAEVTDNKQVVLGLISSKFGELEDKQRVIARIHEAAQFIPLSRLCLSTQCGFASTEEGNNLTPAQQWAKIALVTEIAQEVWPDA